MRKRNRGVTGLALLAVLALVVSVTAGSAVSAPTAGNGQAEVAKKKKKKCKKGFKKVKKKNGKIKCVKKKPKPVVRATITWTNADSPDADLDLAVFDAAGNVARSGATAIPKSTMSPDVSGTSGSETFTDLSPKPLRNFSYGVCYTVGGSAHAPFTITYVTADGQSHTVNEDPGSSFFYKYLDGPPIGDFCAI